MPKRKLPFDRSEKAKKKVLNHALKPIHHKAIHYYMMGNSMTDSMIKAGYSRSYARNYQYIFFSRPSIYREIEKRRNSIKQRSRDQVQRVQDELAKIAFFNIGELIAFDEDGDPIFDFDEATMDDFAAIGEVQIVTTYQGIGKDRKRVKRVKVKPYDKKAALDSLARIHGLFQENAKNEGDGMSLEERLQAGRDRVRNSRRIEPPNKIIEADYELLE